MAAVNPQVELSEIRKQATALNAQEDFGEDEQAKFDDLMEKADGIQARLERDKRLGNLPEFPERSQGPTVPTVLRYAQGDNPDDDFAAFLRGDGPASFELRASNAADMVIGTDAAGGYAVPTGHLQRIIARRDETMLADRLGVQQIPGTGTTVNVPIDNEDDGEFVQTAEAGAYDKDTPALTQVAMTLVDYTKIVPLSKQLLADEDSQLLSFLEGFVGRGLAKTHNDLLVSEVASNGTALKTTASATALATGELEDLIYNNALGPYLDDSRSVGWVMQPATHGKIVQLGSTSAPWYVGAERAPRGQGTILGQPVYHSVKVDPYGTTAKKFALFGNWSFVGMRGGTEMTVLRDPFSRGANGIEQILYSGRVVYKVLQPEAIGYIKHA